MIVAIGGDRLVIYADVLVALNILITYILIVAVRLALKIPTNKWAVMFASVIGGFTALIIFWDDVSIWFSLFYKIVSAGIIVAVAILPKKLKAYFKAYLAFFLVSFLFGGAVYALEITLKPQNILYYNGTVYFDMSISYLVGCILSVYGVFLLGDYLITKHTVKGGKCQLEISYNSTIVNMIALVDTGNSLTDGMTGKPVIVAELAAVSPLFSREEMMFLKNGSCENIPKSFGKNFRLIPTKAVTGESVLRGFAPDFVKIKTGNNTYTTSFCTVAVTDGELSQGEYRALVNNNIFENGREEKNDDKAFI